MAAKVADQTPLAETRRSQSAAANNPKISMLGAKSGVSFVIPKNKLSGSLVPVVRGGGKLETHDAKKEEDAKLPQRKTKWGIDLTQDAAVKRGRALAYQTRAEQIAAQLESGNLEIDYDEATRSPSPPPVYDSSGQRINTREARKRAQLDLERREAIGECIRLNPNYKPPAGYKPVYKETTIYIPVKEYPGFNFVGLILGPQGSTKKRLEEETGTKIIVQGMGDAEEGKIPGIHLDGRKVSSVSEDLPVHISADTYEKVDAAMGLLELLVTTVDGNIPPGGTTPALSSGDSSKALDQGGGVLDTRYSIASSELSQSTALPVLITSSGPQPMPLGWSLPASTTEAPGGQFRPPPGNWNLMAANNSAMQVPVGFSVPPNSSSHTMNNGNMFFPRFPRSGFSPFHPFPFVRGRPPLQGFNPHAMPLNLRNTMFGPGVRARQPFHVQPRPYMPETVSQNQSAAVMNPTGGVFGSPRPHPVPGGSSQSAYPVYPTGSNATLVLPPSNPMVGGGAGPPVFREGNSASAPLAAGPLPSTSLPATSHVPVSVQHSEGAYQRDSQFSGQPSNQLSHSGTAIQLSSGAPPGAHAAPAPPVASPVGPSPRLSPAAPPGAHGGAPPPVVSPVGPSPRLSPAAPPGAHGGAPPPVASPVVPSAANVPLGPPPRVAFIPQAASAGLSPVALPVISSSSNPPSSSILALGGGMHNTVTISLGAPVGTMQSGTANRSIGQPPVSAGSTLIISQGSSVLASAAANTWQPQHLTSGDFTFQPLRSQAPPSSSVWSQPSQPPSLADVCPQNPIPQNPVPQNPVSVMRPGFQPVIPSFPLSLPPQIRVNAPSPPAPPTPPAPPAPPMPPLPPQAPSFRPAISPSSSSLGISSQPVFSVPSQLSGSQSIHPPIPPPRPAFLGPTAQPMPPRPPPVVLNPPVVPPFGSSAPQALRPPLPPMPHPGPDNHPPLPTVPGIPNFQRQEALTSQPFQHPSVPNVPVPPRGLHPVSTSQGFIGNSSAAFSGDVSKQLPGPVLLQQQSSPTVLHNNSAVPSNIQHNPMSTSPQLQLPASPQLRPIVPGQSQASMIPVSGTHGFDFGHGGSDKTSHLPVSTGEGASNQSYDPFSPTSIPAEQTHLQNDEMKIVTSKTDQNAAGPHDRPDTDAEYENLMASVGVR